MSTTEQPIIGTPLGHANTKGVVALWLGSFALLSVVATALSLALHVEPVFDSSAWLLIPSSGFLAGMVACYLGSVAWVDVSRGITGNRLLEAQVGAVLGGMAVVALILAATVLALILTYEIVQFGASWNPEMD